MEELKNKHPNIWDKVKGHVNAAIRSITTGEWNDLVKAVDYRNFASITELRTIPKAVIGQVAKTVSRDGDGYGGGGTFQCVSTNASGDGYIDDGGAIIVTALNDAFEIVLNEEKTLNVEVYGAKGGVRFFNNKSIGINVSPVGVIPSCLDAFNGAIAYLDKDRHEFPDSSITFNVPTSTLLAHGHYYIDGTGLDVNNDIAINIPNGINFISKGSFHTNFDGTNIMIDASYNTTHIVQVYRKLWLGIHNTHDWYVKTGNTVPNDTTSIGVVLNSSRGCDITVEAIGFNENFKLGDTYGAGNVNNVIRPKRLWNGRRNFSANPETGGWCNQHEVYGGSYKMTADLDKHLTIKTDCESVYLNGNNITIHNPNLEGGGKYKHLIYDNQGDNVILNPRIESSNFVDTIWANTKGMIVVGGSHNYPNNTGDVSDWENRDGSLDGVIGYTKNLVVGGVEIARGQISLKGNATTLPVPNSTSTIRNSAPQERYWEISRDRFRVRHLVYGEDENGAVEWHTHPNDFVDLRKEFQKTSSYLEITHQTGVAAGIGHFLDNTLVDGKWYFANKPFVMGVDLAADITAGNFQEVPRSLPPVKIESGVLMSPDFTGIDTDGNKVSGRMSNGSHDLHDWDSAESLITIATVEDGQDIDPTGMTPTIFFNNTSGSEKTITFDKTKVTAMRGGYRWFQVVAASNPVRFTNSLTTSVESITGSDIVLTAGQWLKVNVIRASNIEVCFTEVDRKDKAAYNSL